MRENEFEKQVQKQLEDFQLNPSASVWEQVKDQIKKKKRRRVIFFILLPAALVLLGYFTNYFLFTGTKTESDSPEVTKDRMASKSVTEKNDEPLTTDKTNELLQSKENPVTVGPQKINKEGIFPEKEMAQNQKTNSVVKNDRKSLPENFSNDEIKKRSVIKRNDDFSLQKEADNSFVTNNNVPLKQDDISILNKPVVEINQKKEIGRDTTDEKEIQKDDVIIDDKEPAIAKADSVKTEGSADKKNETIRAKNTGKFKINWGIGFSIGLTSNHTDIFSLDKSYSSDVSYSPGNATGGTPPPVINLPSSVNPGLAFKIGLAGKMQISKRSRFSTGVQYFYASNRIKTGMKQDTTVQLQSQAGNNFSSVGRVDRIYRGTQQNSYTNSYHFIQIPFWYHWQINKGKKLPIQWNVGASVSYLFATNGLVYNSGYGGIYYQDKDAFTKTHFNLGTGLSFRLNTKNRMEWIIGPELSFDMSPLMKNNNKQYLLYGGFNTKLGFLKKKNK